MTKHDIWKHQICPRTICISPIDLGKMIGMSDEQVSEYFKEVFPQKKETQLLEIKNIYVAIGKTRAFHVWMFRILFGIM